MNQEGLIDSLLPLLGTIQVTNLSSGNCNPDGHAIS